MPIARRDSAWGAIDRRALARLWHQLWHRGLRSDPEAVFIDAQIRRFWLAEALHNRKRPTGEAGRFWGYYREERYLSLYMWIRGRWVSPVCAVGAIVGSNGAIYGAGLDLKDLGAAPYVGIST